MRTWLVWLAAVLVIYFNGSYNQVLGETPATINTTESLNDWYTLDEYNGLVQYGLGSMDSALYPFSDDDIVGPIPLPIGFSCGCELTKEIHVSVDGFVVLGPLWDDGPPVLPDSLPSSSLPEEAQVIGPLWTDFCMEQSSVMWYHVYFKYEKGHKFFPSILDRLYQKASNTEGFPVQAVVITWENMMLEDNHTTHADPLTFQLVLLTDSVTTFAVFNYANIGRLTAGDLPHPAIVAWQCKSESFYSNLLSPSEEYSKILTSGTATTLAFSLGRCSLAGDVANNFCRVRSHDKKQKKKTNTKQPDILCPCLLKLVELDERFSETEADGCFIVDISEDGLVEEQLCCYKDDRAGGYLLQQTVQDFLSSQRFGFQVPERIIRASTPPPDTTEEPSSTSTAVSSPTTTTVTSLSSSTSTSSSSTSVSSSSPQQTKTTTLKISSTTSITMPTTETTTTPTTTTTPPTNSSTTTTTTSITAITPTTTTTTTSTTTPTTTTTSTSTPSTTSATSTPTTTSTTTTPTTTFTTTIPTTTSTTTTPTTTSTTAPTTSTLTTTPTTTSTTTSRPTTTSTTTIPMTTSTTTTPTTTSTTTTTTTTSTTTTTPTTTSTTTIPTTTSSTTTTPITTSTTTTTPTTTSTTTIPTTSTTTTSITTITPTTSSTTATPTTTSTTTTPTITSTTTIPTTTSTTTTPTTTSTTTTPTTTSTTTTTPTTTSTTTTPTITSTTTIPTTTSTTTTPTTTSTTTTPTTTSTTTTTPTTTSTTTTTPTTTFTTTTPTTTSTTTTPTTSTSTTTPTTTSTTTTMPTTTSTTTTPTTTSTTTTTPTTTSTTTTTPTTTSTTTTTPTTTSTTTTPTTTSTTTTTPTTTSTTATATTTSTTTTPTTTSTTTTQTTTTSTPTTTSTTTTTPTTTPATSTTTPTTSSITTPTTTSTTTTTPTTSTTTPATSTTTTPTISTTTIPTTTSTTTTPTTSTTTTTPTTTSTTSTSTPVSINTTTPVTIPTSTPTTTFTTTTTSTTTPTSTPTSTPANTTLNPSTIGGPDDVSTTNRPSSFPGMLSYGRPSGDLLIQFSSNDDIYGPLSTPIGFACDCDWSLDLHVSVDGFILLGEAWDYAPPTPPDFANVQPPASTKVVAPFWTDIRLEPNRTNIWYNQYYIYRPGGGEFIPAALEQVYQNVSRSQNQLVEAVKVTWENMAPVNAPVGTLEGITFQLLLMTDSVHTYCVFNFGENSFDPSQNNVRPAAMTWYKSNSYSLFSKRAEIYTEAFENGNTGLPGRWAFQLDDCVENYKNEENVCFKWSLTEEQDPVLSSLPLELDEALPPCPCSLTQMKQDDRFNRTDIENCYGTLFSPNDTLGYRYTSWGNRELACGSPGSLFPHYCRKEFRQQACNCKLLCCYDNNTEALYTGLPLAGYLSVYNPVDLATLHEQEDVEPFRSCCERSDLCEVFVNRRPVDDCQSYDVPDPCSTYGDPHILTLDGKSYTYNGVGEYVLLQILNKDGNKLFELHGRTEPLQVDEGAVSRATVFTGFAAEDKVSGGYYQVETSLNRNSFIIYSNTSETAVDSTNVYRQGKDIRFNNVVIRYLTNTSLIVTLKNGISAAVYLVNQFLDISLQFPVEIRQGTKASGLLGNMDGDPTNEFQLPDGTILPDDITDQQIYQYAENWRVNSTESLMHYRVGRSHADYQNPAFVPLYLSDFTTDLQIAAQQFCGSNDNFGCVYDYLVTADISIANSTLNFEDRSKRLVELAENHQPEISFVESQIFVELDQPYDIVIEATDADDDLITLYLVGLTPQPINSPGQGTTTLIYTLVLEDLSPINASVYVVDSKGVSSMRTNLALFVCPECNNGFCDFDSVLNSLAGQRQFTVVPCKCDLGWIGTDCLTDRDGCQGTPCFEGAVCTDVSPAVEQARQIAFSCTCITGYQNIPGVDRCQDVDECATGTSGCEQLCENVLGSYMCLCDTGFRKAGTSCIDVNECLYGTDSCQQICTNTDGGYQCSCQPGYTLNSNNRTCDTTVSQEDLCREQGCDHSCVDEGGGDVRCTCDEGYITEGNTCIDRNECEDIHECAQICINTLGAFECACFTGFHISDDDLTCIACEIGRWGEECRNDCNACAFLDTCDPVYGCICKQGWKDTLCDVDVNECNVDPDICDDPLKTCVNTVGSYVCNCNPGYELTAEGQCIDIDECLGANDCPVVTSVCVNKVPGFHCKCAQGYQGDGYNCTNIDECALNLAQCEHLCEDRIGYYNCDCFDGFVLNDDRKTCSISRDPCEDTYLSNEICIEQSAQGCKLADGEPMCFCCQGYNMTSTGQCVDLNECLSDLCAVSCNNFPGGYECGCFPGSILTADQLSCQACNVTLRWGPDCSNQCNCGTGALYCDSLIGCVCKAGWTGSLCDTDINECKGRPCFNNQKCTNIPGSFTCSCSPGFELDNGLCKDIDECALELCNQRCDNTQGSYMCLCWSGYEMALGSNQTCVNVDECAVGSHECQQICVDVEGSHFCTCHPGFNLQPDFLTCVKDESLDPCSGLGKECVYGCYLLDGKPICHCPSGFILDPRDNCTCLVVYKAVRACMNLDLQYSEVFNIHGSSVYKAIISDVRVALLAVYAEIANVTDVRIEAIYPPFEVEHVVAFRDVENVTYDIVLDLAAKLDVFCHSSNEIMVGSSLTRFIFEPMVTIPGTGKKSPVTCLLCDKPRICILEDPDNRRHTCTTPRDDSRSVDLELEVNKNFISAYTDRLSLEYAGLARGIKQFLSDLFVTVDEFAGLGDNHFSPADDNFNATIVRNYIKFNHTVQPKDLADLGKHLQALLQGKCLLLDNQCVIIRGEIYLHRQPAVCWTCSPYELCLDSPDHSGYACVTRTDDFSSSASTGDSDLILGLGLGFPLVLLFVLICVIVICMVTRRRRTHSRYSDSSSSSTSFFGGYQSRLTRGWNYENFINRPQIAIIPSREPNLARVPITRIDRQDDDSRLVPIVQHGAVPNSGSVYRAGSQSDISSVAPPHVFYKLMETDFDFRIKRPRVSAAPTEIYSHNVTTEAVESDVQTPHQADV